MPHTHNTIAGIIAVTLALLLVAAGLLLQRPPHVVDIDVGDEGPFIYDGETTRFRNFYVFYSPEEWGERSFRWTHERGTLTIPFVQRAEPLMLELVACGCRVAAANDEQAGASVPVELYLNNQPITTLQASDHWTTYRIPVEPDLAHPDYGLMLDMYAPVWTDASNRQLGLAVDRITVRQMHPPPLADPLSLPALLAGGVVLLWWRRPGLLLLLAAIWLLFNSVYVPQFWPRWLFSSLPVVSLLLLWRLLPPVPPHPWRTRYPLLLLLATTGGVWLVLTTHLLGHWVIDDAFISFRYAQNLVDIRALVFNAGERVEGYTNFLWTLLMSGAYLGGIDPLIFAGVLTMLLACSILALTVRLALHFVPPVWAWAGVPLLALSSPFLLYTARGSGMETALFTALILATLLALLHRRWRVAGVLVALTLMTRPDGVLLGGLGGLYALWIGWQRPSQPDTPRRERWRARLAPALSYGLTVVLLYGPYFLWRWWYYGYLLPNTFYVKVGSTWAQVLRGVAYLTDYAISSPLLPLALLASLVGWWVWLNPHGPPASADDDTQPGQPDAHVPRPSWGDLLLLYGLLLLMGLYIVAVGGDWMPGQRFFVPLIPLLVLVCIWGLANLARRFRRLWPVAAVVLLVASGSMAARLPEDTSHTRSPIWIQNYAVRRHREVGRWIQAHTPRDTWIATAVIGAIPYYAERPTIDILGLTDEHIAHLDVPDLGTGRAGHEKTDLDYVVGRKPAIIPYKGSDLLWDHAGFRASYELTEFPGPEGHSVQVYLRDDAPVLVERPPAPASDLAPFAP